MKELVVRSALALCFLLALAKFNGLLDDDRAPDGVLMLVLLAVVYFVPTFVATARNHPQRKAIIALNILLGWTFLGWVAALVWSFIDQKS